MVFTPVLCSERKRSRIGFGKPSVHAKPCYYCSLPVQARQGTLRSRALTRLNWRDQRLGVARPAGGSQGRAVTKSRPKRQALTFAPTNDN